MSTEGCALNTDRELYREPDKTGNGSYYSDSIHVARSGSIGIDVGGTIIVKPLRDWHALALRQPPQPTGDVGELVERLRTCARGFDYPDGQLTPTGQTIADAANLIVTLDSRSPRSIGISDDDLLALARRCLGSDIASRLTHTVWKDSIDIDEPSLELKQFAAALTGAGEEGE